MSRRIAALLAAALVSATAAFAADPPRAVWVKAKCALCHGLDGSGDTEQGRRLSAGDLRSADSQKQSDDAIAAVITSGRRRMPAFGQSLDQSKISSLVLYIRELPRK
jgi:mono/diheme cytochrome c family protein